MTVRALRAFPSELSELLSPRGRRFLDGPHPLHGALATGRRFVALHGFLDTGKARACLALLEKVFVSRLRRMEQPVPPEATWRMTENYSERLPKTARVWTAMLDERRTQARRAAEECGLFALVRSPSFHRLAELLNGRPTRRRCGVQLLCYGAHDYAGPHNDHHPEDAEAKDGYVDVHLTFANRFVRRQLLVYERRGHFSEVEDVARLGALTAYRLPFWHWTTPLEPRARSAADARRWVVLGTFLDAARPRAR